MTTNTIPILANFDDVRKEIWEGDLILIRSRKGVCVHAATAAWWGEELFCLAVHKYRGLTACSLEQLVCRYPGRVEIFEVNPQSRWSNFDRPGVTAHLKNVVLTPKDCRNAFWPLILKWFGKIETTGQKPCGAEAIRLADRFGGGVEPVPDKINERIAFSDLEASPLYRYRFTLK